MCEEVAELVGRQVTERPAAVMTVTSTVPVPAGFERIIWEAVSLRKLVTFIGPKSTAVAPARFVPVIVTSVPPVVGPAVGLTAVTAGSFVGLRTLSVVLTFTLL